MAWPSFKPMTDEQSRRYGELAHIQPRRDYLDALDAESRVLRLRLVSGELLRTGNTKQDARMRRLAADLRAQVREQMKGQSRRSFRGEVAVFVDLAAMGIEQPPTSPPAVKAYLDLLQGLVYPDDRVIRHLRVRRNARDNPILGASSFDFLHIDDPRFPSGPPDVVDVEISVMPLRTYIADFDRAFRLHERVFDPERTSERLHSPERGEHFWLESWDDLVDDERFTELRREHRDDLESRGAFYGPNGLYTGPGAAPGLRASMRAQREAEIKGLRNKLLLVQRPGKTDRPGPENELDQITWDRIDPDGEMRRSEYVAPGSFYLPLPPVRSGMPRWAGTVRKTITEHRAKWPAVTQPFDTPLALDIAVRGAGPNQRDLDNLARDVLGPFEAVYCNDQRGTVVSYRVYESEGREGVRVLVMTEARMQQLEETVAAIRQWVLERGPQKSD